MSLLKKLLCGVLIFVCSASYAEEYVIHKIRVSGLQRISLPTVLSYLPVKDGDRIDSSQTVYIIRALYKTNFFSDVSLKRRGNDLLISVVEREVIGSINVSGNSKINKKQMSEVLQNVGLVEGRALDKALLNGVVQALIQQYYNLGLYGAKVSASIKQQERNRVAVAINIKEGPVAKISSIKIVGNKLASEKSLLKLFSSTTPKLWSFFTRSDQYSKEKLDADLEKLRSYYMDRGYLQFKVDSTRVAITPDKKNIYITINITEGALYKIKGFSLDGSLKGKRSEVLKLIIFKKGDVFSRKNIINVQASINQLLGDYGYGMPDIQVEPVVDDKNKQIFIKFMVDAGHRVYIHRINFLGNTKTHDDVLRREMRLQEGSLFSLSKLNESRRRLANLGYLQNIEYKTTPVQDRSNQVDLTYSVKEVSAVSASVQGGYSDADGFLYGASITDPNVLGTGKSAAVRFDNSKANQYYSLAYTDPYFTVNAISFSINAYLQKSNQSKINLSSYSSDTYGVLASFGIPLSDYDRVTLGFGVEHIKIKVPSSGVSDNVLDFLGRNGSAFNQFKLVAGWRYSNFDRAIFPTKGFSQGIRLEGYGPLNRESLEFYKIDYDASWYQPLVKDFIFHATAGIGYGDSFGKTKDFPFFKNFFAGGIGSVRGFENGGLGSFDDFDHAIGGNILTTASASVTIPTPMSDTIRPSIFFDIGNVYNDKFKLGDLRSSCGIQVEWHTPLAPLVFSLAKPIHHKNGDHLDMFQFTIAMST
jgi:outer membrane protein insertion porin family